MPISSAFNPMGELQLVQGGHHGDHPKVVLKVNGQECSTPFTLLENPGSNQRTITFQNNLAYNVRTILMGFTGDFPPDGQQPPASAVKFRWALTVYAGGFGTMIIHPEHTGGATKFWVGAWWNDDGAYPDNDDGKSRYFNDHPVGGGHHTVPVIYG